MSVSVLPNWRIWKLNPNATIDECLALSMGLSPEIAWLKELAPFNDSIHHWNQPAPRASGSLTGRNVIAKSAPISTEELVKNGLAKCKWAQAFPNLSYEERTSKHRELNERARIVANQKQEIEKRRSASARLAGLTCAGMTFSYFHTELGFEMPNEVIEIVEKNLSAIEPAISKEPTSKAEAQLAPRAENSYSILIFALLSQLEAMDKRKFPFPWEAGAKKNLNQTGITRALDFADVKLHPDTTTKILTKCKEWAEGNGKLKS